MKPGAYLKLRREAAGLSIADVALLLSSTKGGALANERQIASIEAGTASPIRHAIERLRGVFPFDPHVLRLLAAGIEVAICRRCGCSDLDPCDHEIHGACAWADANRDLCTACVEQALRESAAA